MNAENTALIRQTMPFAATLGVEALDANPGEVALRLPWAAELCTGGGQIHGGVIMTLADSAGAVSAFFLASASSVYLATVQARCSGGSVPLTRCSINASRTR